MSFMRTILPSITHNATINFEWSIYPSFNACISQKLDADIHQGNSEFRKLLEFSDLVKSASPDSQDVIDKTVTTIKTRLAAVSEARKQKVAELDKIKSQW